MRISNIVASSSHFADIIALIPKESMISLKRFVREGFFSVLKFGKIIAAHSETSQNCNHSCNSQAITESITAGGPQIAVIVTGYRVDGCFTCGSLFEVYKFEA